MGNRPTSARPLPVGVADRPPAPRPEAIRGVGATSPQLQVSVGGRGASGFWRLGRDFRGARPGAQVTAVPRWTALLDAPPAPQCRPTPPRAPGEVPTPDLPGPARRVPPLFPSV